MIILLCSYRNNFFHFFLFRCFPQFLLRANLCTLFLIPECTLLSFSIVRSLMMMSFIRSCRNKKYMCLSVFPCMSIACSNSLMHALCAAVTTSFCHRHPAL